MDWYKLIEFGVQVLITGFAAVGVTWYYSKMQLQLSNDEFQRGLFTQFNERYDKLNDELHALLVHQKEIDEQLTLKNVRNNSRESYKCLNDYLNLCAEEYYWYKKGRVDPTVWKAWKTGIEWWFNELDPLKELWENEKKNGNYDSYYLEDGESFLSIKRKEEVKRLK
jgi:hypothetical protein